MSMDNRFKADKLARKFADLVLLLASELDLSLFQGFSARKMPSYRRGLRSILEYPQKKHLCVSAADSFLMGSGSGCGGLTNSQQGTS